MANHKGEASASKLDAAKVALSWLERGILTVPLGHRSKRPSGGEGWNNLRVTEATLAKHFRPGNNVGALWGEPSGWVIDVDLDWDEAAVAARSYMAPTFTYGRVSRPETHYLYRSPQCSTRKWNAPDGSVILEIRSTGTQSVVPPSMHPDNERYEIDRDVEFTKLDSIALRKKLDAVAAIAMLARVYPTTEGRHDFIHAFTGALLRDRWRDEEVRQAVKALLDAVGDKESDRSQRERTVENTIKMSKGRESRTWGWKTLGTWVDEATIKKAREWLGRQISIEIVPGGDTRPPLDRPTYRVPSEYFNPPGLVGEISRWSERRSYLEQPVFDLAVGLMCTALATTNRYVVDGWDTPLQPYFMLLAPTAAGKDAALTAVYEFSRRARLEEFVFQGFQSYHALLDRMAGAPHMACWLWDEAARKLKTASRMTGSQDFQVMTWLLSLYGKANSHAPGVPGRHNAIEPVDFPFLTIMAAAQGEALVEAITTSDLSTGVINRFILFDTGDIVPPDNLGRENLFSARLETAIKRVREQPAPSGEYPFVRIPFDNARTHARFTEFSRQARERASGVGAGEMWGRANQNALILAGIQAVGVDPAKPLIDEKVAEWAIGLTTWAFERWEIRLEKSVSRTLTEGNSKRIEQRIIDAKKTTRKNLLKSQRALLERGLMPRTVLLQISRDLTARELDSMLESLIEAGLIGRGDEDGTMVYWSKA